MKDITADQLKIRIHHIGGIGGYGPSEVLDRLGHVEWTVYDADQSALSSAKDLHSGERVLVNKCIGGTNSPAQFHVAAVPSASSMLRPALSASRYTVMLPNGSVRVWGSHALVQRSVEMRVNTIDTLVESNEVAPPDFLSIDAQGAELAILEGASEMLRTRTVGVLCEVEFAQLYEGQPLFCDIQYRLRRDGFRLCDIHNVQYLNTDALRRELMGKGFMTVGEALFLRDVEFAGSPGLEQGPEPDVGQYLKLAAISVAFDQLDYALGICRHITRNHSVSLDELADRTSVTYVRLLRDLSRAAEDIERSSDPPRPEPLEKPKSPSSKLGSSLRLAGFLTKLAIRKGKRKVLRRSISEELPAISRILYDYGLEDLAAKHFMRAPEFQHSYHLYKRAWEHLAR